MIRHIREFYSRISGPYELVNSFITLGLDYLWRKKAVRAATAVEPPPRRVLDMCSGTGQTAFSLAARLPDDAQIIAADFSPHMLGRAARHAEKKKQQKKQHPSPCFTLADAVGLPFADNTFDMVTITFATRNLDAAPGHLADALREFHRVLKPGGYFFNLETSQPRGKVIRALFHFYVKMVVTPVGWLLSGSRSSYAYLSESIRSFHAPDQLVDILLDAGFSRARYRRFLLGATALHIAQK